MIERKIVIGLITSTEYLQKIRPIWDPMLIESSTARMLAGWAVSHFDKYNKAAGKEIESIFFKKVNEGLDKEIAEEIEEDILPDLSEESINEDFDLDYLVTETFQYFKSRQLIQLSTQIENLLEHGKGDFAERLEQAEQLRQEFIPIQAEQDNSIDLSQTSSLKAFKKAFTKAAEPLVTWPKQLGEFWNAQFVPGGFLSLLAPEKRGKTFWLLEIAIRAAKQGRKVAFFQAGDMNEAEQLRRIGVYLCKRSNLEKYCKEHYEPVRDCIRNQFDECDKKERECDFGIFSEKADIKEIRLIELEEIIEAYADEPKYRACYNCKDYDRKKLGVPWVRKIEKTQPITYIDVRKKVHEFFIQQNRNFKLVSYANGTLSVGIIETQLDKWQFQNGFIPELIIIDYADLLVPSIRAEFRHQQNQIWKELRRLSQTPRATILPLVVSPTQADAKAYKTYRLNLDNFSEDKRKFGHVTAMYGFNQDPLGREKALGLMRINEIVIREGEYSNTNEVTVLQNLRQGRPFKGSYF